MSVVFYEHEMGIITPPPYSLSPFPPSPPSSPLIPHPFSDVPHSRPLLIHGRVMWWAGTVYSTIFTSRPLKSVFYDGVVLRSHPPFPPLSSPPPSPQLPSLSLLSPRWRHGARGGQEGGGGGAREQARLMKGFDRQLVGRRREAAR